jgi:hypothetical protein
MLGWMEDQKGIRIEGGVQEFIVERASLARPW